MSIAAISLQTTNYTASTGAAATQAGTTTSSQSAAGTGSSSDSLQLSGASGSGSSSSTCLKGYSTCMGCGACSRGRSTAANQISGVDSTTQAALQAYNSQMKYL